MTLSATQRRALLDTLRRGQPLAELERKARKSKRRRGRGTAEETDLALAKYARVNQPLQWGISAWCPINYCSLCSEFGRGPWDEATKRFAYPIAHKPRCPGYGPDTSPYPGFSAVVSPLPAARA